MNDQHSELENLGWSGWFARRTELEPGEALARVAAVDRNGLLLADEAGFFRGRLAGSFLHRYRLAHQLPCVGDWVRLEKPSGEDRGIVHGLVKRKTALRRKAAGDAVAYQMIAANLDTVVIVQSCHFDFNLKRLERYLVMVMEGGADPWILLTKTDLVTPAIVAAQVEEIRSAGITAPVILLSNVTRKGMDTLTSLLEAGKTYCFVGSSGVGKSTLINHLAGREIQETRTVSGTGEGRHTTVRRELIRLEGGALVIDNPGMREFGIVGAEEGMEAGFPDIAARAAQCRYRDCGHTGEPGCAVVAAVASGGISREHYENYLKLRNESEFHDMSYSEKRKKDKDFGRFIKSAKKSLKRK